ncbi:hypothetical protein V8C37DRAFT_417505 [Trichoderma ceciliae]
MWSVCLTQSAGRYLVSGCRAGRKDEGDFPDATIWTMAKAQVDLLPDTAPRQRCSPQLNLPILCCSSAAVRGAGGRAGLLLASSKPGSICRRLLAALGNMPGSTFAVLLGREWDGLAWFSPTNAPPPRKGSCSPLNDPMIRLRSPPRTPLPGSGPRCNETVWLPCAGQTRRGVSPAIGRAARVAVSTSGGVLQCQRFGEQPRNISPVLWVSHRSSDPRNRHRVLAVA